MDLYDVGRERVTTYWLRQIAAPLLLIGIRTDWLYPPEEVRALAAQVMRSGGTPPISNSTRRHGHDAFLKEWDGARRHAQAISRSSSPGRGERKGDDRPVTLTREQELSACDTG